MSKVNEARERERERELGRGWRRRKKRKGTQSWCSCCAFPRTFPKSIHVSKQASKEVPLPILDFLLSLLELCAAAELSAGLFLVVHGKQLFCCGVGDV